MSTTQIAKAIDLKRFISIVDDLPKIEQKRPINLSDFDIPIMGDMTGKKIQLFLDNLTITKCEKK